MRLGLVALGWCVLMSGAHALDCKKVDSTAQMAECAKLQLDQSELKLNAVYQQVLARYSAPGPAQNLAVNNSLVSAQRLWWQFRKADCHTLYLRDEGGTIRSLTVLNCMLARTDQRIAELAEHLVKQ